MVEANIPPERTAVCKALFVLPDKAVNTGQQSEILH
jgi:hypothetical protein